MAAITDRSSDFTIASLRGGLNDTDPPMALRSDQCTDATNLEFNLSTVGEKRRGCVAIDLPSEFADANLQAVTFLYRHLPTDDETASELWAMAQHLTTQHVSLQRKTTTWSAVSPVDVIDVTNDFGYDVDAQTLHGKMFLAFRSVGEVNRLHVWDGTTLRRVGLPAPVAAPVVADTVAGGTYTGVRYARVRFILQDGSGKILVRSEPSDASTFTPSSANTGMLVTKPAASGEGETHWELELSTDNSNFYRTQTLAVGTTTATDTTVYAAGYAQSGVLSETSGDYSLIPSVKYLAVDQDRLLVAGSFEDDTMSSRVSWTPVFNDPGFGNDERIPIQTNNSLDLDGTEGGAITGMSSPVNGYVFVFKWSHIYKLVRQGVVLNAYQAFSISKTRGALPKSIVEGMDSSGQACLYFLDPKVGPCRLGSNGLQTCGQDILTTWKSVNINATVVSRAVYYPDSRQVHWWIATNGSEFPNQKIVMQTNLTRDSRVTEDNIVVQDGVRCGWSKADNRIAQALAVCLYAENVDDNDARSMTLRPFIGLAQWTVGANTIQDFVQRCDTGDSDGWTVGDDAAFFRATGKTKPYTPSGILNRFGVRNAALMATASAGTMVALQAIRDFGVETIDVVADLSPEGSETHVIVPLDNFSFSGLKVLEVAFGELDLDVTPSGTFQLHQIALKPRSEESS